MSVAGIFIFLVLLWITRDFSIVDGWSIIFQQKAYISDTTPAIFCVIILFMWPKENVFKGKAYNHLIAWKNIETDFPWKVILLEGNIRV